MMFFLETLGVNEVRSLEAEMAQVKVGGGGGYSLCWDVQSQFTPTQALFLVSDGFSFIILMSRSMR